MSLDTASYDFHRDFPVTPEKLWELLTDPAHREKWGAPDAETVMVVETADVRVGGQDRVRSGPAEAPDFAVETRWYDLTKPKRAVMTETLLVGEDAMCTSLVTYVLSTSDQGSHLALTVAVSSFTGPEALDELKTGWDGGLSNLEALVASLGA